MQIGQVNGRDGFGLSRAWTLVISLVLGICAVLLFWRSVSTEGAQSALLPALASTILSVGLALAVTEFLLKPIFTHDLVRLVNFAARLEQVAVSDVLVSSNVQMSTLLKKCKTADFIVAEPSSWLEGVWPAVLQEAKENELAVKVFVAKEDAADLDVAAKWYGVSKPEYARRAKSMETTVSQQWAEASRRRLLNAGSRLDVIYLRVAPRHQFASLGASHVLTVPSPVEHGSSALALVLGQPDPGIDVATWLRGQVETTRDNSLELPAWTSSKPAPIEEVTP